MNQCIRCGYQWNPRSETPLRCPCCKSTRWNRKVVKDKCMRCGAEWVQRGKTEPKYCPVCHSAVWKVPRAVYYCPKCGRTRPLRSNSRMGLCPDCDRYIERRKKPSFTDYDVRVAGLGSVIRVWSDGRGMTLTAVENDRNTGYLYSNGTLIGSVNLSVWCRNHSISMDEIARKDKSDRLKDMLGGLARSVYSDRDTYSDRASNIQTLHGVSPAAAACIALHDAGMDPLPISLKLGIPFTDVMDMIGNVPPMVSGRDIGPFGQGRPDAKGGAPVRLTQEEDGEV